MTLKNSFLADGQSEKVNENKNKKQRKRFLADVYENMKRRNWVFWLSFLTFLCYFP